MIGGQIDNEYGNESMGRQRRRNFSVGMKKSALYAVRSVDIVADTASLARYKLVVVPALNVLTPEAAGHLVLGQRSAMKEEDYSLWPQRQPRPFTALLGARVEQFTRWIERSQLRETGVRGRTLFGPSSLRSRRQMPAF